MSHLASLPIVVPLLVAAVLVAGGSVLPKRIIELLSVAAGISVCVICGLLAAHTAGPSGPFAYWLGGLRPRGGVAIGISLSIDPIGAGLAGFAALMVLAALVYALRYFDTVDGLFHGLMLLFMAGMVGFCLTGDLFNMVVFFELMSVVAYALTAYRIEERAPIQGAINFAITNSIGGYGMFIGVALLYGRTGALNLAEIGSSLSHHGSDGLVAVAFALLLLGFLTKAAAVPLHFWLADAHAVAPTPVCVLFSGVMVELGLYAVARIYWVAFVGPLHSHAEALRVILITLGAMTAVLGAVMCVLQRHIKRLLAFSTISHVGLMLCGIGLLHARALAGVALYLIGHGFTKAALFMCCGVLLHRFRTVDEYDLHGRGRQLPLVGIWFVVGGLLLAALPPFTSFAGKSLIESDAIASGYGWLALLFTAVGALTGGAVLRVSGRVFLGWGPSEGPDPQQARASHERVDETRDEPDHTPPLMVLVPALLLCGAVGVGLIPGFPTLIQRCVLEFEHGPYASWVLHGAHVALPPAQAEAASGTDFLYAIIGLVAALGVAAVGLFGRPLRDALPTRLIGPVRHGLRQLRRVHSGHIGDYIAWWTAGAGALGVACVLSLR